MKINILLYIILLLTLYSCSSSKIEVRDGSQLSSSRSVLLAKLDSIYKTRLSTIHTYNLHKARFDISLAGSSHKLNGRLNIETNSSIKATVSLPFPPISVGNLSLDKNHVEVTSSIINLDINKSVSSYYLPVVNSIIYGVMPMDLLKFFRLKSLYISDNRYHLEYSGPFSTNISFQVDPLYRISQISLASKSFSGEIFTTDYKIVDSHSLPSQLRVILSSESINGSVNITTNSIKLNK